MIKSIVTSQMDNRSFIVFDDDSLRGVVVDPSFESAPIRSAVDQLGVQLDAVLLTHGHIDHMAGVPLFPDLPIWIHGEDEPLLSNSWDNGAQVFGASWNPVEASRILTEGEEIAIGPHSLRIIHTPGHTAGGITVDLNHGETLIVGDLLFRGSVGRTDLPSGNQATLIKSLKRICDEFDNPTILPGHGDATTLNEERESNPFLQAWLED